MDSCFSMASTSFQRRGRNKRTNSLQSSGAASVALHNDHKNRQQAVGTDDLTVTPVDYWRSDTEHLTTGLPPLRETSHTSEHENEQKTVGIHEQAVAPFDFWKIPLPSLSRTSSEEKPEPLGTNTTQASSVDKLGQATEEEPFPSQTSLGEEAGPNSVVPSYASGRQVHSGVLEDGDEIDEINEDLERVEKMCHQHRRLLTTPLGKDEIKTITIFRNDEETNSNCSSHLTAHADEDQAPVLSTQEGRCVPAHDQIVPRSSSWSYLSTQEQEAADEEAEHLVEAADESPAAADEGEVTPLVKEEQAGVDTPDVQEEYEWFNNKTHKSFMLRIVMTLSAVFAKDISKKPCFFGLVPCWSTPRLKLEPDAMDAESFMWSKNSLDLRTSSPKKPVKEQHMRRKLEVEVEVQVPDEKMFAKSIKDSVGRAATHIVENFPSQYREDNWADWQMDSEALVKAIKSKLKEQKIKKTTTVEISLDMMYKGDDLGRLKYADLVHAEREIMELKKAQFKPAKNILMNIDVTHDNEPQIHMKYELLVSKKNKENMCRSKGFWRMGFGEKHAEWVLEKTDVERVHLAPGERRRQGLSDRTSRFELRIENPESYPHPVSSEIADIIVKALSILPKQQNAMKTRIRQKIDDAKVHWQHETVDFGKDTLAVRVKLENVKLENTDARAAAPDTPKKSSYGIWNCWAGIKRRLEGLKGSPSAVPQAGQEAVSPVALLREGDQQTTVEERAPTQVYDARTTVEEVVYDAPTQEPVEEKKTEVAAEYAQMFGGGAQVPRHVGKEAELVAQENGRRFDNYTAALASLPKQPEVVTGVTDVKAPVTRPAELTENSTPTKKEATTPPSWGGCCFEGPAALFGGSLRRSRRSESVSPKAQSPCELELENKDVDADEGRVQTTDTVKDETSSISSPTGTDHAPENVVSSTLPTVDTLPNEEAKVVGEKSEELAKAVGEEFAVEEGTIQGAAVKDTATVVSEKELDAAEQDISAGPAAEVVLARSEPAAENVAREGRRSGLRRLSAMVRPRSLSFPSRQSWLRTKSQVKVAPIDAESDDDTVHVGDDGTVHVVQTVSGDTADAMETHATATVVSEREDDGAVKEPVLASHAFDWSSHRDEELLQYVMQGANRSKKNALAKKNSLYQLSQKIPPFRKDEQRAYDDALRKQRVEEERKLKRALTDYETEKSEHMLKVHPFHLE